MNTEKLATVRFQDGDIKDFYTALETYSEQYHDELQNAIELQRKYGADPRLDEQRRGVEHIDKMTELAKEIYDSTVLPAIKAAAAKMRQRGDANLKEIADALESGDYSRLAL